MGSTHAAAGLALGAAVSLVAPEYGVAAAVGGAAGGFFPDLDVVVGYHRRTLHYPDYYWLVAAPAGVLAVLAPGPLTVGAALFFASAALHSTTDVLGGGLGRRPWEADDDRGVYCHHRGRWIEPRRWVRYDGAPEDLLVAAALSVPPLVVFEGAVRYLTVALLAASAAYVLVRKRLPEFAEGWFT